MSVISFNTVYLKQNRGYRNVGRVSFEHSCNEFVTLMDSNVVFRFDREVHGNDNLRQKAFSMFRQKVDLEDKSISVIESNKNEEILRNADIPPFSVAMCVYGKDNPEWFDEALHSVINQTIQPNEIVLVVDGPIPDSIQNIIDKYSKICADGIGLVTKLIAFQVVYLKENQGLGKALRKAVAACRYEIIARMDSDDIAVRNRFELQLEYLMNHPDTDILGGQIEEFIGEVTNIVGKRIVPLTDRNCKAYLKKRCPFNHVAVMYKKSAVLKAGNYKDWFCNEDYYLWVRMALDNCIFANLPEILVRVRVGEEMYARRGGEKYFKSEEKIQRLMLQKRLISVPRYLVNVGERSIIQVLMPNTLWGWVLRKFARKR